MVVMINFNININKKLFHCIVFLVLILNLFCIDFQNMSEEEKCSYAIGEVLGNCLVLEEFSLKFPNLEASSKQLEDKCKNNYKTSLENIDLYLINTIGESALINLKNDLRNNAISNKKYKELIDSFDQMSEVSAKEWINQLINIDVIYSKNTSSVLEKYSNRSIIKNSSSENQKITKNSNMTILEKTLLSGDYSTYFLILIISFILTYSIGLSIPLLLRFIVIRKNFSKPYLWITLVIWFILQIEFWSTYGNQNKKFHGGVIFATIFSYNILKYGRILRKKLGKLKNDNSMLEESCPECNEKNIDKLKLIGLTHCPQCGKSLDNNSFSVDSTIDDHSEKVK